MAVTWCKYNSQASKILASWSRTARMYASPSLIFVDYERLNDTKWAMTKAFKTVEPFTKKINDPKQYWNIWIKTVSPKWWERAYAEKMQRAVNWYIADISAHPYKMVNWEKIYEVFQNIRKSSTWVWTETNDQNVSETVAWNQDLDSVEEQFVKDLCASLEAMLESFKLSLNPNLYTFVRWCINDWVLWYKIDNQFKSDKESFRWTWLWALFWIPTWSWSWTNNILWLLWLYDWNKNQKYELTLPDWTKKKYAIADMYSPETSLMQELWWLLFSDWTAMWNDPIMQNPNSYRNAIKNFMKATDKDKDHQRITSFVNKLLQWWAMWKLSAYFLNLFAWACTWISCLTTWYLNVISYKQKNSPEKINQALELFWFKKWYFKFEEKDPASWVWNRVSTYFQNMLWTEQFKNWPKSTRYSDKSRDNVSIFDNEAVSWMFMWPMNILWDTIRRWDYQMKAMDLALQKLWWDTNLENRLFKTDAWGRRVPDEEAAIKLMTTFLEKMADITWFPDIEWWWQLIFKLDATNWVKDSVNAALKMFHWMTGWWTNHVNNIYKILVWWAVWALTSQESKDKAYEWCWGKWIIRRYTRWMEKWWVSLPWEHAQALVSKKEFAREMMRIIAGIRNVYRFWNLWCRDDENWDIDWWCAFERYLSVVYLPYQALEISHPIFRSIFNFIKDSLHYKDYFKDKDLIENDVSIFEKSFITNFVKPLLRSMWLVNTTAQTFERDAMTEDNFVEALWNTLLDSSDWLLYYIDDQVSSYVHSEWAYWPRSVLNDDMTIFWANVPLRKTLQDIKDVKDIETLDAWNRKWFWEWLQTFWQKVAWLNAFTRWSSDLWLDDEHEIDASWLYESEKAEKLLLDWNSDEDLLEMAQWNFTKDMKEDSEFMQYVWTNLTQDRQSYWANFKEWVRDNKYNTSEIDYFETLLKKDMDELAIKNPWLSDLEIYDAALKKFFDWTPTYEQIKKAIQAYDDAWESAMWVYTDYLASAAWLEETAWVKWLALVAEYRKRQYMDWLWIQYSSNQSADEKKILDAIENKVAWELWPYLRLADRRQYSNLMWEWFLKNHPEYKWTDPFKWLTDDDWNINMNWDIKTTWTLWVALRANNLARTELVKWEVNWYELSNVFTEKFWSPLDENWNFDDLKAAQMIDTINYLSEALEDSWMSPVDIALTLAPTLTKNLQLWDYVLWEDTEWNLKLREYLKEEWVDRIRWLLYDTYSAINDLPELLEELENEDFVDKILSSWSKWYKKSWWWGSLYHWKNTSKNYDYYNKPANVFNGWWSKNLSKLANGYGKSGKRSYAWNYSPREFYFLNQRSYRNPINSTRIAPDIPLTIWGFSKTTVKSKNPVSGFTTNIKPWEERSTAKFGKSKGIVWWSKSRWPVSSFKA